MLIINDVHVGFDRKGGTTTKSREKLRTYLHESLAKLLLESDDDDLLINGDLFDDFEVDPRDWVDTFQCLSTWLVNGRNLYLVAGNHDHSPRANKVSSFEMLCTVLSQVAVEGGGNFYPIHIDQWRTMQQRNVIALAHCSNQDVFNFHLGEVLSHCRAISDLHPVVFVHANYENKFAVESDHSLNVSEEVAREFRKANATLIFAHEHQARTALGGYVQIMGNQWPTSVADCLGNDAKRAHRLVMKGVDRPTLEVAGETWSRSGLHGYVEIDWRELADSDAGFVKVVGEATANEASDVINNIARFRVQSEAFVITNGVKIAGISDANELPKNFEAAKAFDVMEFISQHLDGPEMEVINKKLMPEIAK